jgi:hypothetical protein
LTPAARRDDDWLVKKDEPQTAEEAQKIWTLEAANAVLPQLRPIVKRQLELGAEIEERLDRLSRRIGRSISDGDLEVAIDDDAELAALKRELSERVESYDAGWRRAEALGAVLKDPRTGLFDFYGRIEGKLVWLCWRYDEPAIEHYHDLDAGFRGRVPLTQAARKRMLN